MDKLVHKLKKHDEKALIQIMDQYTPLVATIVSNVARGNMSKEDIEETVSDVFVTLWNNSEKIQDGKLKGYICSIARTRAINKANSLGNKAILNIDDYDPQDDFSIEDATDKKDVERELREVIGEIPEPDKEILIRHYYFCETASKISENMSINIETVKSKLRRTRDKLKKILTERGYTL
ncbi:MAG: sigma-70 family RNA polymerase sigma factor [Ruminococcus sp.]|nr:sigma-70 family RNA polymerase sigma factor [Ruminococcus sp.]